MASGVSSPTIQVHEECLANSIGHVITYYTKMKEGEELHLLQKTFTEEEKCTLRAPESDAVITFSVSFNAGVFARTENKFSVKFYCYMKPEPPLFRRKFHVLCCNVEGIYRYEMELLRVCPSFIGIDEASYMPDAGPCRCGSRSCPAPIPCPLQQWYPKPLQANCREGLLQDKFECKSSVLDYCYGYRIYFIVNTSDECLRRLRGFTEYNFSKNYFKLSQFSDLLIVVNDKKLPAHRWVLSERSTVFQCMFETEMAESINGIIKIDDFESSVVQEFLEFLYTGSCATLEKGESGMSEETLDVIIELFRMSDKYNVAHLKIVCVIRIRLGIHVNNVLKIFALAYFHEYKSLALEAKEFFETHREEIVPDSQSLLDLVKSYYPILLHNLLIKLN